MMAPTPAEISSIAIGVEDDVRLDALLTRKARRFPAVNEAAKDDTVK
jgi:hypothetical protein